MATTKRTTARTTATGTRRKSSSAKRTTAPRGATARAADPKATPGQDVVCTVPFCPICTVITTAQTMQPEILGHLLAAARELSMAAREIVDNRGDQVAPATRLQRIDLA
jgi:hypothetical protein